MKFVRSSKNICYNQAHSLLTSGTDHGLLRTCWHGDCNLVQSKEEIIKTRSLIESKQ